MRKSFSIALGVVVVWALLVVGFQFSNRGAKWAEAHHCQKAGEVWQCDNGTFKTDPASHG